MFVEETNYIRHTTGRFGRPHVQHPAHDPVEHERGEESTGEFATFTRFLWEDIRGDQPGGGMVVVPAAVEGAALATALVPFVLHRWDMYRWDKAIAMSIDQKEQTTVSPFSFSFPVWNEAVVIKKKLRQPRPPKNPNPFGGGGFRLYR